jgi:hypothetical protein
MNILPVRQVSQGFVDVSTTDSPRKIGYFLLKNVVFCGRNLHYPNLLAQTSEGLISPYDERVMSLQCDSFYEKNLYHGSLHSSVKICSDPVYFFAFNVDNYFHFIYDTLPYLYYFFQLQQSVPNLRLLIQTSSPTKQCLPTFVQESLSLLGVHDYILVEKETEYREVYIGLSLTHGGHSNEPPHPFSFSVWKKMVDESLLRVSNKLLPLDKLYISRRSWLSKHPENIGTNYTTRRRCMNEDDLVGYLESKGYTELFCEDLSMAEKIFYFSKAKSIAGIIGGGMCNALFSPSDTRVHCLNTPAFLDINARFLFSMNHTDIVIHSICSHAPHEGSFTLYTRAKIMEKDSQYYGRVGEISGYQNGSYELKLPKEAVAGFSQDFELDSVWISQEFLSPLDAGLNSPFVCDLKLFQQSLDSQD